METAKVLEKFVEATNDAAKAIQELSNVFDKLSMKTYTATITKNGRFVASLVIPHDGIHKGARKRASTKAQAWKAQMGFQGKITITTQYGTVMPEKGLYAPE